MLTCLTFFLYLLNYMYKVKQNPWPTFYIINYRTCACVNLVILENTQYLKFSENVTLDVLI